LKIFILIILRWMDNGYGFGNGALFHTTDGGANWNSIPDF
jgi:hypothetical protein